MTLPSIQVKDSQGSASQHWCTPLDVIQLVQQVLHWIDLDPFSNPGSLTGAYSQWYGPDVGGSDGFELSWAAVADTVFFNPPWKRSSNAVRKADAEYRDGCEIIGLIPCSMNSQHWPIVERAPAYCYPHKRPSFLEDGVLKKGNPKDVAIVYWGQRPFRFADVFRGYGRIKFGPLVEVSW